MTTEQPNICIIDDDDAIRTSLSRNLQKRGFRVCSYPSAEDFLSANHLEPVKCIVLDYGMPGMNGLELQEQLNEDGSIIPIIFVTGHGGVPESVRAIRAGAIDFLEKPFRTEVLVERIQDAIRQMETTDELQQKSLKARQRLRSLTARETEVVEYIVANPSNSTSKEVARALDISPRTVDHHRARILEKLNIRSVVELIDLALAAKMDRRGK